MLNYKYMLLAGGLSLAVIPGNAAADTCSTLPNCADIGFTYTAAQCGALKKLKCPFGDAYFCSGNNCNSVSVGTFEVCTKYCEDDRNVCVEKRAATCKEYIQKVNGVQVADGATISGTQTKNLYLMGTVKNSTSWGSSLKFAKIWVYDAADIPACKEEMGGKTGFLDVSSLSIDTNANFDVKTNIDYISFYPNGNYWSASFYKDTNIGVNFSANRTWATELSLYFSGTYNSDTGDYTKTNNNVRINCSGSDGDSWNPSQCNVNINLDNAEASICKEYDGEYVEINLSCNGYNDDGSEATCNEDDYNACYW